MGTSSCEPPWPVAAAVSELSAEKRRPSQLRQLRRSLGEQRAEIELLIVTVRASTLDVVETICRWRDREARARAILAGGGVLSGSSQHGRRAASPEP